MTIEFKKKLIDKVSYEAASVFDVNNDGKFDIVSGEYWYEWASNTGAYKNHRPSLTVRHSEEPDTGPGEGYEYNGTYQGYDIWFYNDTVNYYGLDNPNYWVSLPVTIQIAGEPVTREDSDTYDSEWIENGDYWEIWGNETYRGNYYDEMIHAAALWYGEIGINRCESVKDGNIKVGILGFERTWGTQTSNNIVLGYIGGFSKSYSGSWANRISNDAPMVATEIRSYDDDTIELNGDAVLASAEAQGADLYLDENACYLMRYEILSGLNGYGGSLYQYHYRNRFYTLNRTTGEVSYYGQVQYHFNYTSTRWNSLDSIELIECKGGAGFDAYAELYVSRGFNPEIEYTSDFEIWKNGTKIKEFPENSTIDDITDYIDDLFDTKDPENPSAGSQWTGSEPWYIDRQRTQLYFTIFGLGFIIPPWIIAAHKRRIDIIVTALLLNVLGIALLYGVGYI